MGNRRLPRPECSCNCGCDVYCSPISCLQPGRCGVWDFGGPTPVIRSFTHYGFDSQGVANAPTQNCGVDFTAANQRVEQASICGNGPSYFQTWGFCSFDPKVPVAPGDPGAGTLIDVSTLLTFTMQEQTGFPLQNGAALMTMDSLLRITLSPGVFFNTTRTVTCFVERVGCIQSGQTIGMYHLGSNIGRDVGNVVGNYPNSHAAYAPDITSWTCDVIYHGLV